MTIKKVNDSGKGARLDSLSSTPDGLATMKLSGATKAPGVKVSAGYPGNAKVSGDQGGMPGSTMAGNGTFGGNGVTRVRNVMGGAAGSGHIAKHTTRAAATGYDNMHPSLKRALKTPGV